MGRIVLDGISKHFANTTVLDNLCLDVPDGELFVLLGPSGCGKSTALRIIAGLDEATSGTIMIGDRVVNDVPPADRDVAMVFQSYALYPHMNVRKNIEFPLKARKVPKPERDRLVTEAAESLALTELLDRRPRQLSGGQRQRVAVARAIVRQPALFLMDEPLSNLDAALRARTRAELVDLHARMGTTIIYVTHDQVEAMTMGQRVGIMTGGRLRQVGPPSEVYDRPADRFVAEFIGSPPMSTWSTMRPDGQGEIIVGVRPEHFRIDDGPLKATVEIVEALGHEHLVVCAIQGAGSNGGSDGSDAGAKVSRATVRVPSGGAVPKFGEVIGLSADPQHMHWFDPVTGARIEI